MSPLVRTLMLWLLTLAVPMQGLAAATMQHCGPHHARVASAAAAHDHAAHRHADLHDHGAVTPGRSYDEPSTTAAVDADHGQASSHLKGSSKFTTKCSACASCCSAVALPAAVAQTAVVQQHASRFPPLSLGIEPFVTDGPDRPPRSFLA